MLSAKEKDNHRPNLSTHHFWTVGEFQRICLELPMEIERICFLKISKPSVLNLLWKFFKREVLDEYFSYEMAIVLKKCRKAPN